MIMQKYTNPKPETWSELLKRPTLQFNQIEETVQSIFKEVQLKGDAAIQKYTAYLDGVSLSNTTVSPEEMEEAFQSVPSDLKEAIAAAKQNIEAFHAAQKTTPVRVETQAGVVCWQEKKPIQKVGLYIPGGTAPLFSTVLMLAIPARIAECQEVILCTPAVHPAIFYAAKLCGVTKMAKIGGSQAIAALSLGTESVPAVYKIFGPGNQYVTAAKMYANRLGTAIDMPAGPSEVLVIADDNANPVFVAADLLSQAEHGPDSQVVLVSPSEALLVNTISELKRQTTLLPRAKIAEKALSNSRLILTPDLATATEVSNQYAPEHLIIQTRFPRDVLKHIRAAGSVFLGAYTPESVGDYASGTNHVLPTYGYSRAVSSLSLADFSRRFTVQELSAKGLLGLGQAVMTLASNELLDAHKNAVAIRLASLKDW